MPHGSGSSSSGRPLPAGQRVSRTRVAGHWRGPADRAGEDVSTLRGSTGGIPVALAELVSGRRAGGFPLPRFRSSRPRFGGSCAGPGSGQPGGAIGVSPSSALHLRCATGIRKSIAKLLPREILQLEMPAAAWRYTGLGHCLGAWALLMRSRWPDWTKPVPFERWCHRMARIGRRGFAEPAPGRRPGSNARRASWLVDARVTASRLCGAARAGRAGSAWVTWRVTNAVAAANDNKHNTYMRRSLWRKRQGSGR
jgi:hypothetical protein